MTSGWMKWAVVIAFAMHGLGMLGGGLYLPFAVRAKGFIEGSWLLDRVAYPWLTSVLGLVVWVVAGIGFIGAAVGLWQGASWWTTWAWVGGPATLLAVALFAGKVVPGVYAGGALAVAVLYWLMTHR